MVSRFYMGTLSDWASVVVWGGLWAGVTAWAIRPKIPIYRSKMHAQYMLMWIPLGLLFGIMTTFHWQRAVHRPLIFVTLATLAAFLLSAQIFRYKPRE